MLRVSNGDWILSHTLHIYTPDRVTSRVQSPVFYQGFTGTCKARTLSSNAFSSHSRLPMAR